ncbi:hypothetical protein [Bauldia sp.]|uniref:hypothetical protein n=1 Tax=Bauldia sp. TaxID=2575872 RepID=UPI003BADAB9A
MADIPDLTGKWACDPAPMIIRGERTTLTYTFTISDLKDGLFTTEMYWSLPPSGGAQGNQEGVSSFSGKVTVFGAIGWDNRSIEMVAFKDLHRHVGTIVDADTIRFIHSEIGDNAWVSRSVCRRAR